MAARSQRWGKIMFNVSAVVLGPEGDQHPVLCVLLRRRTGGLSVRAQRAGD
jgi:hypothetical protein